VGDRSTVRPAAAASLPAHPAGARPHRGTREGRRGLSGTGPPARASGRVVGALFLFALLILVVTRAAPAAARALRSSASSGGNHAARLLAGVVRALPAERLDWGDAMCAELAHIRDRRARWRFSLGCAVAAVVIRARFAACSRQPGGALLRAVVFGGALAALALAAYGLAHYPGLRSEGSALGSMAVFLALLVCYAAATLALSHGTTRADVAARRYGLAGGLVMGGSWLLVLAPTQAFKGWVLVPLLVALLVPPAVAALAGRAGRYARTGTRAALWSGIVGGLTVFVVWTTATYVRDGGPYDPGLLRDFHASGARDLATYAVSDNLGSGLVLLLVIPTVALALGSLTAGLASAERRF
jgi:hypothetical protein